MAKKPIGIAIDAELHSKVKAAAADRGTNLEGAYVEALKMWLGDVPEFRGKYAECHRLLQAILLHASPLISKHIQSALEIHGSGLLVEQKKERKGA